MGKTKRKTSARDKSPTTGSDAPINGRVEEVVEEEEEVESISDLSVPAVVKFTYTADREDELNLQQGSGSAATGVVAGQPGGPRWLVPPTTSRRREEEVGGGGVGGDDDSRERGVVWVHYGGGCRGGGPLHLVKTLYPFSSVTEEELNFEKGEVMEVVEKATRMTPSGGAARTPVGGPGAQELCGPAQRGPRPRHAPRSVRSGPWVPCAWAYSAGGNWYYGNITRQQAEAVLNERAEEGDFLIRDSESSVSDGEAGIMSCVGVLNGVAYCHLLVEPSDFSVSLKALEKNKHFKVLLTDGSYCIGQRRFASMDELSTE
ncbi:hypothetical protein CRUP_021308 [Coryphaenoides rupestris]|nr:hypothetical protein CRUP_021308 [Coryphaenoides rupestris]